MTRYGEPTIQERRDAALAAMRAAEERKKEADSAAYFAARAFRRWSQVADGYLPVGDALLEEAEDGPLPSARPVSTYQEMPGRLFARLGQVVEATVREEMADYDRRCQARAGVFSDAQLAALVEDVTTRAADRLRALLGPSGGLR